MDGSQNNNRRNNIPLQRTYSNVDWIYIFKRYDYDHDDQIPIQEFIQELQDAPTAQDIPILIVERALKEADRNGDNVITLNEFLRLVKKTEQGRSKTGRIFTEYIRKTIPPRDISLRRRQIVAQCADYTDGEYEDEYKFWPPPLGMVVFSLLEAVTFFYDTITSGYGNYDGPIATKLAYNPYRRIEIWRFLTYMFVHAGVQHLLVNLAVQIMLGIPLEMVHKWWRVLIIYLAGVIAGSIGTSVFDPTVFMVGASGGVYALITAHLATVIMNWSEMKLGLWQLIIILILCIVDTGSAIYNRYVLEINKQIGYEAHLAGAIAGLLVGIYTLRNLEVHSWENKIWWVSLIIYIILMLTGITINIAFPSHFPKQKGFLQ